MKKMFVILLTIVLLVSLSACNRTANVPEQMVVYDVEEKFNGEEYEYTITHQVDNDTHIDTVTVNVVVTYRFYNEHIVGHCSYRYNKSDDTWDSYQDPKWEIDHIEYIPEDFEGSWNGSFEIGGQYSIDIEEVDFQNKEVTGTFSGKIIMDTHTMKVDEVNEEGTFPITEVNDGYQLEITNSLGQRFTFRFSKNGVKGYMVYV